MKNLLLLRHAKALKGDPNLRDFDRPLNDIGLNEIPKVAEEFKKTDIQPDLIICSSAKRTSQTAQRMADQIAYKGEIKSVTELYEANCDDYIKTLRQVSDKYKNVMIVGHNPTEEEFLSLVCDKSTSMSTGALAIVKLSIDTWKEFDEKTRGKLIHFWQPKEL